MHKNLGLALFPKTRASILATMLLQPDRWWYLSELAQHLGTSPSSLQRELMSLTEAGILSRRARGRHVYYRANPECPVLAELTSLMVKTAGLVEVLREALRPFAQHIPCAFVYGSLVRGEEISESDVDLMLISALPLSDIVPRLREAGDRLSRDINPSVYTPEEIASKLRAGHHFLTAILKTEKLFLLGSQDELEAVARRGHGAHAPNE